MTGEKPSPTAGIFSSIARRYDAANRIISLGRDMSWRRAAVRELDLPTDAVVLDLATGTADLAIAAIRYGGAARVVATDVNDEMMLFGMRKAERQGLADRIRFLRADAESLPFADSSFDAVTVAFGVRNFADRAKAFREVWRVLRPGARFVCLEFTIPPLRVVRAAHRLYLRRIVPPVGWAITGEIGGYRYLADSIQAFPDARALADMLVGGGFSQVRFEHLTFGVVAVHVATKQRS